MPNRWTPDEVRTLWRTAYVPVLRSELRGVTENKAAFLRRAESKLPGRTYHTCMDRCYRISEVLNEEGLPWVMGWKPPSNVGQTPNSAGVSSVIRQAVLAEARREFGK